MSHQSVTIPFVLNCGGKHSQGSEGGSGGSLLCRGFLFSCWVLEHSSFHSRLPAATPSDTVTPSLPAGVMPAGPAPSLGGFLLPALQREVLGVLCSLVLPLQTCSWSQQLVLSPLGLSPVEFLSSEQHLQTHRWIWHCCDPPKLPLPCAGKHLQLP